jgi:hypothetical protein
LGRRPHANAQQLVLGGRQRRSHVTATPAYGYETEIVYVLARDGTVIADDDARVGFETDRVAIDGKTGKPVADVTRYTFRDADTRYVVSFEREKTILQAVFTDRMPFLKRIAARLIGFDGAYHRFTARSRSRNSRRMRGPRSSKTTRSGN